MSVTVIHGTSDRLVPCGNAVFARKALINASSLVIHEVENMGHFVPWNHPELIKDAVVRHIENTLYIIPDGIFS